MHGKTCSLSTASAHYGLLIGAECSIFRDIRFRSLEFCGEAVAMPSIGPGSSSVQRENSRFRVESVADSGEPLNVSKKGAA